MKDVWITFGILSVFLGIFFYSLHKADQRDKKIPDILYSGKVSDVVYLPSDALSRPQSVIIFETEKKFVVSGYVDFSNDCADILKFGKVKFYDCK